MPHYKTTDDQLVQRQELIDLVRNAQKRAINALQRIVNLAADRNDLYLDRQADEFGNRENRMANAADRGLSNVSRAFNAMVGEILDWAPDHGEAYMESAPNVDTSFP